MIRYLSIASALLLALIVLYLPAANPPGRFITQMKYEHELNVNFWGTDHAHHILARMLDLQAALSDASASAAIPVQASPEVVSAVDEMVATEMSKVSDDLRRSQYFRSIDTLVTLALYRLAVLVEWWPVTLIFGFALLFDGFVVRAVRSKEFIQHNPEAFAAWAVVLTATICATLIAFALPSTIHPLAVGAATLVVILACRGIVANYHRHG